MIDQHFARIHPIVGTSLGCARVGVFGLEQAAPLVEYLAACGVSHWAWYVGSHQAPDPTAHELQQRLHARHGAALSLQVDPEADPHTGMGRYDLVLACGDPATLHLAHAVAMQTGAPAILCIQNPTSMQAAVMLPGDNPQAIAAWIAAQDHAINCTPPSNLAQPLDACHAPLVAGLARAILLRTTPFARADIAQLWAQGRRIMQLGGMHPLDLAWSAPHPTSVHMVLPFQTPPGRRGTLLVAGLGSIGSVAARHLAPHATQLILADPDRVAAVNPARQHYTLAEIGHPKALALRTALARFCPDITALPAALTDAERIGELIRTYGITAALIATGTHADFAIARALRAHGIAHVVARCYPRARYWEAILVDGTHGPAFEDLRGHVRIGPAAPPTPEQIAAYSDLGALEAEPATLIESGWAAVWAARLTRQLATPPGLRERWMLALLASQRTCLVGGAYVEQTAQGPAYAVDLPGRIWAWGHEQIAQPPKFR